MAVIQLGIDVQVRRGPSWMALDEDRRVVDSGWLEDEDFDAIAEAAAALVDRLGEGGGSSVSVGIDAPRRPRPGTREWNWDRPRRQWRPRLASELGNGRHCEVILRAAGIANPQWTPMVGRCPEWMELGFRLFDRLERAACAVHEVFPSASYYLLEAAEHEPVTLDFAAFRPGPKDMIDACVSAYTVGELAAGRGVEVGSDGLGTIVLPRPLPEDVPAELLRWPGGG